MLYFRFHIWAKLVVDSYYWCVFLNSFHNVSPLTDMEKWPVSTFSCFWAHIAKFWNVLGTRAFLVYHYGSSTTAVSLSFSIPFVLWHGEQTFTDFHQFWCWFCLSSWWFRSWMHLFLEGHWPHFTPTVSQVCPKAFNPRCHSVSLESRSSHLRWCLLESDESPFKLVFFHAPVIVVLPFCMI